MWDAVLLIGTAPVGAAGSVWLVLLFLVNVGMQVLFVGIIGTSFTDPHVTDEKVAGLKGWRMRIAHSVTEFEMESQKTLARRICEADSSLDGSTGQSGDYETLQGYAGDGDGWDGVGIYMCTICLLVYVVSVSKELNAIFSMARAVNSAVQWPARAAGQLATLMSTSAPASAGSRNTCGCRRS